MEQNTCLRHVDVKECPIGELGFALCFTDGGFEETHFLISPEPVFGMTFIFFLMEMIPP